MRKLIAFLIICSMILCSCTSFSSKKSDDKKSDVKKMISEFTADEKKKLDDINYLCSRIEKNHGKMYRSISIEKFNEEKNKLIAKISKLSATDFNYEVSHLLSLLKDTNASCTIIPEDESNKYMMPLQFFKYSDGFYVTIAFEKKYLGSKVIAINGMSIDKVVEKMRYIVSCENDQAFYGKISMYLFDVPLLKYMKIIDNVENIKFTLEKDNKRQDVTLKTDAKLVKNIQMIEHTGIPETVFSQKNYSSKRINDDIYYIQYNKCAEDDELKINKFVSDIKNEYDKKKFKKIVVDFRRNTEVSEDTSRKSSVFVPVIQEIQELNKQGVKVYELISSATIGTCISNCLQLKKYTNATIVGSPTGSSVNPFVTTGFIMMMPNSGVKFDFSNKYIENDPNDKKDAIYPDAEVDYTFKNTMKGEDLEMKWIQSQS